MKKRARRRARFHGVSLTRQERIAICIALKEARRARCKAGNHHGETFVVWRDPVKAFFESSRIADRKSVYRTPGRDSGTRLYPARFPRFPGTTERAQIEFSPRERLRTEDAKREKELTRKRAFDYSNGLRYKIEIEGYRIFKLRFNKGRGKRNTVHVVVAAYLSIVGEAISTNLDDIYVIDNSRTFLTETFNNLVNNKIPRTNIDRSGVSLTFSTIFYPCPSPPFLLFVDWLILLTSCTSLSFAVASSHWCGSKTKKFMALLISFRERHRSPRTSIVR